MFSTRGIPIPLSHDKMENNITAKGKYQVVTPFSGKYQVICPLLLQKIENFIGAKKLAVSCTVIQSVPFDVPVLLVLLHNVLSVFVARLIPSVAQLMLMLIVVRSIV